MNSHIIAFLTGLWLEPSLSSSNSCFTTLKNIKKRFPLKATLHHSYPILPPQRLYSQHSFHYTPAGNCLDAVEIGDQTVVMHIAYTSGDQRVVASRLMPGWYYQTDELIENNSCFHLEKQGNVLLDQHVYQVVSKALHNDVNVLVRTPTTVQLFGWKQTGFKKENQKILSCSVTSDAALSNVVPGFCSLVTVTGKVTLHDSNATHPVWTTHCRDTKEILNAPARIFRCGFGRHPLFLLVGNESSVYLYDTRVHPNSRRTIFDIKKVQDCVSIHEDICSFVSSVDQPHMYMVMNESVYVVDDRQIKTPLMHWRHMLPKRPIFSTLKKLNSLEMLILSNSQNKEVCMISNVWEYGRQLCHGVSVPCHFSILHDTRTFAHSHGLWFTNQVQQRLEDSKWLGMTSVLHPHEHDCLLFLSMHSCGDIFLNTFQNSYLKTDLTRLSENEQGLATLRKWETDVVNVSTHNWSCHNTNFFDVTAFCHQLLRSPFSQHSEKILAGLPEIKLKNYSISYMNIKGSAKNEWDEQVFSNSENSTNKCLRHKPNEVIKNYNAKKSISETSYIWNLKDQVHKCKTHLTRKSTVSAAWNKSLMETYVVDPFLDPSVDLPMHFSDACTEDSLNKFFPGSVLLDLKTDKIKKCNDFLSPKIINLWIEKELNLKYERLGIDEHEAYNNGQLSGSSDVIKVPEKKYAFRYHTSPLDLTRLSGNLSTYQPSHNRSDQRPEMGTVDESYSYPPRTTLDIQTELHAKSKKNTKKLKKKKRLDGF